MQEQKSFTVTVLLAAFLGGLGIHRFYTGYTALGILQLLTLGGCGIWAFIDFICICFNNYKDAKGQDLQGYNQTLGLTLFFVMIIIFALSVISRIAG